MTRLPHASWKVEKLEGPQYPLNDFCPVPGCPNPAEERHHLWRRSFVGGDAWWVQVYDGEAWMTYGNCIGLCRNHHRQITDNEAKITVDEGDFFWTHGDYHRMMDWQPPRHGEWQDDIQMSLIKSDPDSRSAPKMWDGVTRVTHTHEGVQPGKVCPSCKRRIPKPKIETPVEEKRPRTTWAVGVPVDVRENGAQVLDELVEAARDELARAGLEYGSEDAQKYFVLSTSLALFVSHAREIL